MQAAGSRVYRPQAADCFWVREGQGRWFGCRADTTTDPRTVLGAWLDYAAGCSVLDLSLAECDEVYGEVSFVAERPGPLAVLWLGRRVQAEPGTWWVRGEVLDSIVDRVTARAASRGRALAAA